MDNVTAIKQGANTPLDVVKWLNDRLPDLQDIFVVAVTRTGDYQIRCSTDCPSQVAWVAFLLQTIAQRQLGFEIGTPRPHPPSIDPV